MKTSRDFEYSALYLIENLYILFTFYAKKVFFNILFVIINKLETKCGLLLQICRDMKRFSLKLSSNEVVFFYSRN